MVKKVSPKKSFINPSTGRVSITEAFGADLARLLAEKIGAVYPRFPARKFIREVSRDVIGKRYTERVAIIADHLQKNLPSNYRQALVILQRIMGPENTQETGMFTEYYWLLPVGKFIEKYGLDDVSASLKGIEELTKRNTGEYAIRPFARKYPAKVLAVCTAWAQSKNFHVRRLASEGLRPKLPWATKLDIWNADPQPIFEILELLKEDEVKFVKRSVANHLRDWLKVNPKAASRVLKRWATSLNAHTQWIIKHARR